MINISMPTNKKECLIAFLLFIIVFGLLIPVVVGLGYNAYSQHKNLENIDKFISSHKEMILKENPNIKDVYGFTGGGGMLGIIANDKINVDKIEFMVAREIPGIKLFITYSSSPKQ